jgi:hypothetical protein
MELLNSEQANQLAHIQSEADRAQSVIVGVLNVIIEMADPVSVCDVNCNRALHQIDKTVAKIAASVVWKFRDEDYSALDPSGYIFRQRLFRAWKTIERVAEQANEIVSITELKVRVFSAISAENTKIQEMVLAWGEVKDVMKRMFQAVTGTFLAVERHATFWIKAQAESWTEADNEVWSKVLGPVTSVTEVLPLSWKDLQTHYQATKNLSAEVLAKVIKAHEKSYVVGLRM